MIGNTQSNYEAFCLWVQTLVASFFFQRSSNANFLSLEMY